MFLVHRTSPSHVASYVSPMCCLGHKAVAIAMSQKREMPQSKTTKVVKQLKPKTVNDEGAKKSKPKIIKAMKQ